VYHTDKSSLRNIEKRGNWAHVQGQQSPFSLISRIKPHVVAHTPCTIVQALQHDSGERPLLSVIPKIGHLTSLVGVCRAPESTTANQIPTTTGEMPLLSQHNHVWLVLLILPALKTRAQYSSNNHLTGGRDIYCTLWIREAVVPNWGFWGNLGSKWHRPSGQTTQTARGFYG
jgi:hypothetical protein